MSNTTDTPFSAAANDDDGVVKPADLQKSGEGERGSPGDDEAKVLRSENVKEAESQVGQIKNEGKKFEKDDASEVNGDSGKIKNGKKLGEDGVKIAEVGSDYDSMLTMFDEYAGAGASKVGGGATVVGNGYEVGDMVFGKVKSHPWWPGHIYDEAFASPSVRRTKREGHALVAFFGDSSYGWFDATELIPFDENFAEKSRQTMARPFVKAIEEAMDEASRRCGLGLACRCRNPYNFRDTNVEGFLAVDVPNYEPGGVYSASQIKKARDNFKPREALGFVQQLALAPMSGDYRSLDFVKKKATVMAYRKAVYEEFDETYAQAFGAHPVRPAPLTAPHPSKAPLSGRLVIAEALGKGKIVKANKTKEQVEKDKYLFKRREDLGEMKSQKAGPAHQSKFLDQPYQVDGSDTSRKGISPALVNHGNPIMSSPSDGLEHRLLQPELDKLEEKHAQETVQVIQSCPPLTTGSDEKHDLGSPKVHGSDGMKKAKFRKRPAGDMSAEKTVSVEKKKKRKKEMGLESGGIRSQSADSQDVGPMENDNLKPAHISTALLKDSQVEEHKVGDASQTSQQEGSVGDLMVKKQEFELPQVLHNLRSLALDPSRFMPRGHDAAILRRVFLKFRSLVYQKSSGPSASSEIESNELQNGILPASAPASYKPARPLPHSDNRPAEDLRAVSMKNRSLKHQLPPVRLDDPTKGGRKRGPSDRQEEITAKKKKKLNDLRLLAAEKKAAQKISETQGNGKDKASKNMAPLPSKATKAESGKRVELPARTGQSTLQPSRTANSAALQAARNAAPSTQRSGRTGTPGTPTAIQIKFQSGASLPSQAELRAKFARFGPMDHAQTRVYWQSYTVKLVYLQRSDAEQAVKFVGENPRLFVSPVVKCSLKNEDSELAKARREEPSSHTLGSHSQGGLAMGSTADQRQVGPNASQAFQSPVQLKSCLKKPSLDEGATITGGNGGARGSRVKFMLGGEEGRSEQLMIANRNTYDSAIYADGSAPFVDYNSNIQKVIPPSSLPTAQYPRYVGQFPPHNPYHADEVPPRNLPNFNASTTTQHKTTNVDVATQMLSLLTKCNEIVSNLRNVLGREPYYPI